MLSLQPCPFRVTFVLEYNFFVKMVLNFPSLFLLLCSSSVPSLIYF